MRGYETKMKHVGKGRDWLVVWPRKELSVFDATVVKFHFILFSMQNQTEQLL